MTMRQLHDLLKDDPLACFMGMCDIWRSWHQKEPATFEGCCASGVGLIRGLRPHLTKHGIPDNDPALLCEAIISLLGDQADEDIPDEFVLMCCAANEADDEEQRGQ